MNNLTFFLLLFVLGGCGGSSHEVEQPVEEITPTLDESSKPLDSYISKRGSSDIIEELFNEAKSKNESLSELDNQYEKITRKNRDSLSNYNDYEQNVQEYFRSFEQYLNSSFKGTGLDSTTKELYAKKLAAEKENFNQLTANHQNAERKLYEITQNAQQQHTLLKLDISSKLMKNYTEKELPSYSEIENLIDEYEGITKKLESARKEN